MMRIMKTRLVLGVAGLSLVLASLGCGTKLTGPRKESVQPLLQKEAESLKADGEKFNPTLGVKTRWTIESVEVREQPGNETNPFAGTIRFKIVSSTPDADGSVLTDQSDKRFEYVWSTTVNKWIIQYVPPSPGR
jgi:hypothetical protein